MGSNRIMAGRVGRVVPRNTCVAHLAAGRRHGLVLGLQLQLLLEQGLAAGVAAGNAAAAAAAGAGDVA